MATVIQALVDLGYGIAWRVLDAQYFGVPQRRRRIFIVGHLGDSGRTPAEVLFESESLHGNPPQGGQEEPEAAGCPAECAGVCSGATARVAVPSAEEAAGGQLVVEKPTAFHMTQGPISGDISPALSGNAYIGVMQPVSTLQGGGRRGYRIDAEGAAGGHLIVAALTKNGVGVSGPDDNQAQAGHLIPAEQC